MNVYFAKTAKKEYEGWQKSCPRAVDKIEELISDIIEKVYWYPIGLLRKIYI